MISGVSGEEFAKIMYKFGRVLRHFPKSYLVDGFDSTNLPDHLPYLCPLCLQRVIVWWLNGNAISRQGKFNIDHFPPQSVGGRKYALVCEPCNNLAGTSFDFTIKEQIQFLPFQRAIPGASIGADAEISGVKGRYKSILSVDNDGKVEISLKKKGAKTPLLDRWIEDSNKTNDWKLDLTYREPDSKLLKKALLKAAYLCCFDAFGFPYALSHSGAMIRAAISGTSDEYPIKNYAPFWIDDMVDIPEGPCVLHINGWKTLAVNLKLSLGIYKVVTTILVPYGDDLEMQRLAEFDSLYDSWEDTMVVTFTPVNHGDGVKEIGPNQ